MGREAIVERILSDAEEEARRIVAEAEEKSAEAKARAEEAEQKLRAAAEAETEEKCTGIAEGKAATARLDSAKVLLAEKRGVLLSVYARALGELNALSEKECLALTARLLEAYASEGDEVVFAQNYRYCAQAEKLPVFVQKKLKVSAQKAEIEGGFLLRSEKSDTDLSYGALLAADREEHQAELAAELFG